MRRMKKTIITMVLTLISVLAMNAEEKTAVSVWVASDNFQAYNMSAKPVMKHANGQLTMCVNGKAFGTYDLYDGMKITFSKEAQIGDVNGDENVTMSDANAIVNMFINGGAKNVNVTAADANSDCTITMSDANAVVNMFLHQ